MVENRTFFHNARACETAKSTPSPARNRVLYGGLALGVIATGLLWRASFMPLPPAVSKYGGDALWALMVFVGFGFLLPRAPTLLLALLALTFSWEVEFTTRHGSTPSVPPCPAAWCSAPPSTGRTCRPTCWGSGLGRGWIAYGADSVRRS
jgi:hypothetical protein